jgi:hypothetical protein
VALRGEPLESADDAFDCVLDQIPETSKEPIRRERTHYRHRHRPDWDPETAESNCWSSFVSEGAASCSTTVGRGGADCSRWC